MNATNKTIVLVLCIFCFSGTSFAQESEFPEKNNIGNPLISGKSIYINDSQTFEITGSGSNMWFDKDEFFYVAKKTTGDFILTSKVEITTKTGNQHRKIGLMVRQSMDANSAYADVVLHADGLVSLQYRTKAGANTEEIKFSEIGAQYLQLERKNGRIFARIAHSGEPLCKANEIELPLQNTFFVGMAVCSHDPAFTVTGLFSNIRFDIPAAEGVDGYKTPSASRLELLNTETGDRKVVYSTNDHIEAPNWSRDGKFLVYNSGGKLYRFDLKSGTSEQINTGFAINNNNDHGISFNGKYIAISNHTNEMGKNNSIIYILPIKGGKPLRITEKGPSYWHGWSPDGKQIVYCAERNGEYDVYQISSKSGKERQLTQAHGLDDGPEYSPDGKYIYFNSTRTGKMQIWRMKTDGTQQEQVTYDEYNNWFAHPSPDNKNLIFISYPSEVPANSHPHNQRVMLRKLILEEKKVIVLAYIYGGQGTFNVPSWSPDGKFVAFVSYTY